MIEAGALSRSSGLGWGSSDKHPRYLYIQREVCTIDPMLFLGGSPGTISLETLFITSISVFRGSSVRIAVMSLIN